MPPIVPAALVVDEIVPADLRPAADEERTVVVDRTPKVVWAIVLDAGDRIPLPESSVVLGRAPGRRFEGVRGLAVPDATKTLSKVHARVDLDGDAWTITDLGSTNGVLIGEGAAEQTLAANETAPIVGRFVLGELGLRIERIDE